MRPSYPHVAAPGSVCQAMAQRWSTEPVPKPPSVFIAGRCDGDMRIAYFCGTYGRVSDSFIREEVRLLRVRGHDVQTFALRQPDPEHRLLAEARSEQERTHYLLSGSCRASAGRVIRGLVRAWRCPPSLAEALARMGSRGVDRALIPIAQLATGGWLADQLREHRIEHLHAHILGSATPAMFASMLTSTPFSFTVHGPPEFDEPQRVPLASNVHRAAFVRAISNWTAAEIMRRVDPVDWSRIHVIRCGPSAGNPKGVTSGIPEDYRLLAVGRLAAQKGHVLLIEALDALIADGVRTYLTLVGDGPLRGELEQMVHKRNLEDYVDIRGWASNQDLADLFASARLFVMPSLAEGVPIAIMDAFVHGRPVISTNVGGISELVEHGRSGWLVPPGSVEDLVHTILVGLRTPTTTLRDMAEAGAARVAQAYNFAANTARLASLFSGASAP